MNFTQVSSHKSCPHMAPGIVGPVTLIAYNAIAKLNEGSNPGTQPPACTRVVQPLRTPPGIVYRAPHSLSNTSADSASTTGSPEVVATSAYYICTVVASLTEPSQLSHRRLSTTV